MCKPLSVSLLFTNLFISLALAAQTQNEKNIPEWGKIEDALNNGLSLVYSGKEKDATKVLTDTNAEVQQILDQYWAAHP